MDEQPVTYLLERAAQEREAMNGAADAAAAELHRQLAARYEELAERVRTEAGAAAVA